MTTAGVNVPLALIDRNVDQPRADFDSPEARAHIEALAESIKAAGLIQPITLRRKGERYEIVAGENRWRAHKLLAERGDLDPAEIAAVVVDMSDRERDVAALVENVQRRDLKPIEEAKAFARLRDAGMTVEEIAKATGLAKFRVDWRLSLLKLDDGIAKLVDTGQVDRQVALDLARLPSQVEQRRYVGLLNSGQIKGWGAMRAAVDAVIEGKAQSEMFAGAPRASDAEVSRVRGMESKIESVAAMVGAGWKDGDCVVATKVDPGRAGAMADRIAAIRQALGIMERELRQSAAQAQIAIPQARAA